MTAADDFSRQHASRAAIILCGGPSRRMGRPKHELMFGDRTAIERIVDALLPLVSEVVIVKSADQPLEIRGNVTIVNDEVPAQGPLEGMRTGWTAIAPTVTAVFVGSCDLPLLEGPVVEKLFASLGEWDAVVPIDEGHQHGLCAVYAAGTQAHIRKLRQADERRVSALLEQLTVNWIPTKQFMEGDPALNSFLNVNTPADYAEAQARLG